MNIENDTVYRTERHLMILLVENQGTAPWGSIETEHAPNNSNLLAGDIVPRWYFSLLIKWTNCREWIIRDFNLTPLNNHHNQTWTVEGQVASLYEQTTKIAHAQLSPRFLEILTVYREYFNMIDMKRSMNRMINSKWIKGLEDETAHRGFHILGLRNNPVSSIRFYDLEASGLIAYLWQSLPQRCSQCHQCAAEFSGYAMPYVLYTERVRNRRVMEEYPKPAHCGGRSQSVGHDWWHRHPMSGFVTPQSQILSDSDGWSVITVSLANITDIR